MEYTYNIENKNEKYISKITYTLEKNTESHARIFATHEEAETWATNAIQAMKDNNNVFVNDPIPDNPEIIANPFI